MVLRLLTACSDRQARLWNLENANAVVATPVQSDEVYSVCFSADESVFLTGARNGCINAWDANDGKLLAPERREPGAVYQIALTNAGDSILVAGRFDNIHSLTLADWIRPPDTVLQPEDLRLLGEILSCERIHEGGAATSLSRAEWLERWREFHGKYPDHPLLQAPPLFPKW